MIPIIIIIILFGIALKIPFLKAPLDRDYGIYGYHAFNWLTGKKTPHRDTQENHPPGRWLLYALLLKYFPVSRRLFRMANLTFLVMTNLVVFFLAHIVYGPSVAIVAALCFAVLSSLPTFVWTQSSDEIYQIFFLSLAVTGILTADTASFMWYFLIGLAGFMALFFKQSAYVNTIPLIAVLLILRGTSVFMMFATLTGLVTGFVLTWLFFKMQNISSRNYRLIFALDPYAFKMHFRNIIYLRRANNENSISGESEIKSKNDNTITNLKKAHTFWVKRIFRSLFLQTNIFLFFTVVSAIPFITNHVTDWGGELSIWLMLGFAILTIAMNRHTMPIHFIPLLVPLSILSGHGSVTGYNWLAENLGQWSAVSGLAGLLSLSIWLMRGEIKQWIALEKKGRGHIYVFDQEWEFNTAGEGVGKYLAGVVGENDQIYVWGPEYEIYLWAGCPSPTQNLFCPRPQVNYVEKPYLMETRVLNDLQKNLPKYIVITALTDGFDRFNELLKTHYILERKMYGEFEIYRRNVRVSTAVENSGERPSKPLVSMVILTFNALAFTRQCVQSIRENTRYPHEIIFVDNASTDGTVEYLKTIAADNPNYHLILNDENRGYSAGNNQGLVQSKGDYILLLNNDVLVSDGWLERLVACGEADDLIGLVGPITNWISGWQRVLDVPYTDPADFSAFAETIARKQAGRYTPRRRIAGFAMLIKRDLYEKIGALDERFGTGNYEDDDYCLRAREAGYAVMVAEDVFIHHFGSKTFKDNRIDYSNAILSNKKIFTEKWPKVNMDELMEKTVRLTEWNQRVNYQARNEMKAGNSQRAQALFNRVLATNPVNQEALWGLILISQAENDYPASLAHIKRLLRINPDHAGAYHQLGLIAAGAGDYEKAKSLLALALKKDPAYIDAQQNLAEIMGRDDSLGASDYS